MSVDCFVYCHIMVQSLPYWLGNHKFLDADEGKTSKDLIEIAKMEQQKLADEEL